MDFPEVITYRIISGCNNDCRYCYGPKKIPAMPFKETLRMFDLFSQKGVKAVVITGGEPCKHRFFDMVLRELKARRFKVFLDTNGYYFFQHKGAINNYVDVLGLPLDFPIRIPCYRTPKNFDRIISVLDYYKSYKGHNKPKLRIGTVITNENKNQVGEIGYLIDKYPISAWKLYQFIPVGEVASRNKEELLIDTNDFLHRANEIKKIFSEKIDVVISSRKSRANAYFLVNPDGSVIMPTDNGQNCWEIMVGNVFDKDIVEKWQGTVANNNYLGNAGVTFRHRWVNYPIQPIYNRIRKLARKYLLNGQFYTEDHEEWLIKEAIDLTRQKEIDSNIFVPLIILHDVGYNEIKSNPFKDATRKRHMKRGAILAKEILQRVHFDEDKTDKITDLISAHDNWALGDNKPYKKSKEMALFNDLDFISMLSPNGFPAMAKLLNRESSELLEFLENNEKLHNRPFASTLTNQLFKEKIKEKKIELASLRI